MKEAISAQQHRREREDDRRPRHMLIRCNQCSSEAITGESVKTIAALGTCFRIKRTISRRLATFSPTELT